MRRTSKKTGGGPQITAMGSPRPNVSPSDVYRWHASLPPDPTTDAHKTAALAPCRVCGGPVSPDGPYMGPWREHEACKPAGVWPPQRMVEAADALGVGEVTMDDAILIGMRLPLYSEKHNEPTWDRQDHQSHRQPWGHVDRKALRRAIQAVPGLRVKAGLDPTPCTDGPCAWCGVVVARGWKAHGHAWADGSPAPLCGPCSEVYERRGSPSPTFWEEQRAAMGEAVTGVPAMLGETAPRGLRAFAEQPNETDSGEAWGHLPADALSAYRWAMWGRFGGLYAPPERKAEAVARAAERAAERAKTIASHEAEQAVRADVFGFGV